MLEVLCPDSEPNPPREIGWMTWGRACGGRWDIESLPELTGELTELPEKTGDTVMTEKAEDRSPDMKLEGGDGLEACALKTPIRLIPHPMILIKIS